MLTGPAPRLLVERRPANNGTKVPIMAPLVATRPESDRECCRASAANNEIRSARRSCARVRGQHGAKKDGGGHFRGEPRVSTALAMIACIIPSFYPCLAAWRNRTQPRKSRHVAPRWDGRGPDVFRKRPGGGLLEIAGANISRSLLARPLPSKPLWSTRSALSNGTRCGTRVRLWHSVAGKPGKRQGRHASIGGCLPSWPATSSEA